MVNPQDPLEAETMTAGAAEAPQAPPKKQDQRTTILLALQAALRGYDRIVSLTDLRVTAPLPANRNVTLTDLASLLKRIGFTSRVVPFQFGDLLSLPTPCLLANSDGSECYTLLNFGAKGIEVFNPQTQKSETIHPDKFKEFEEEIQILLMKPNVDSAEENWQHQLFRRIRSVLGHIILASVLINIFALGAPLVSMIIFNKVLGHQAYSTLNVLAIGALTLYIFDSILRSARSYISVHTGARLDAYIGTEVMAHLLRLPLRYFEKTPSGLLTERLRQLDIIRNFLTGQMPMLLVDLAFSIILFAAIFLIEWRIGFIALLAVPIFMAISFAFDKTQNRYSQKSFAATAQKVSAMNEITGNSMTIKSLGLESDMEARHGELLAQTAWTGFKSQNLSTHIYNFSNILLSVMSLIVLYLGSRFIMEGDMNIGQLIACNMLVGRTLAPIRQVCTAWHSLRETQHSFERLHAIMGEAPEAGIGKSSSLPNLRGTVAVENVQFSYAHDIPPALRDVSLTLPVGSMTGIVGPSGCGKSTLGKVMVGVYKPSRGRVMIGDIDIAQISPISLRREIGYVPQENQLFAGTVRDNILLGVSDPSPARAIWAAQFVGAHDFIQLLPQGYDSMLGERGGGLSSGQRQLLCIARAMAREPRLIVMDEATSALDLTAEEKLMINLRQTAKKIGLTVVFITHRLGTLRLCDQVVLLKDGTLVKQDTPDKMFQALLPPSMQQSAQPPKTEGAAS